MKWLPLVLAALSTGTGISSCVGTTATLPQATKRLAAVPIGANIDGIQDWSRTLPFNDLVKQSRAFGTAEKPWEAGIKLDAQGWPAQDFGVILMTGMEGVKGLGGTYKMTFRCQTTPQIALAASPGKIENLHKVKSDEYAADLVMPPEASQLFLSFRQTSGGVRDLKVMRPTSDGTLFDPTFIKMLRRFSNLRFMDWAQTNGNRIIKWADRAKPEDPSYSRTSVPWEVCLDLANLLEEDAWINIPIHADEDYIASLAKLCATRLKPGLKLYIENSNEVWNWGFEQAQFNLQSAKSEVKAGGSDLNFDGDTNEGNWAARRVAKRLMQIRAAFEKAYGSRFATTVRPVLATQIVWPGLWLDQAIHYIEKRYGDPGKFLYAIAGAPYFNLGEAGKKDNLTADQVLAALKTSVENIEKDNKFAENLAVAKKYNLKWLAYEGGPDTFGGTSIQAKKLASKDPRIQAICETYLRKWFGSGGGLFNWFVAGAGNWDGQYGTWGLTDDMSVQDTPKARAIDALLRGK